jgi:hypothetical protein
MSLSKIEVDVNIPMLIEGRRSAPREGRAALPSGPDLSTRSGVECYVASGSGTFAFNGGA